MWETLNWIATRALDVYLAPFAGLPDTGQLLALALPVTALALLTFRLVSNQTAIRRTKERMQAGLLEAWLFRDDPLTMLRAQGRVVVESLRYVGHAALPLLVMLGPIVLVIAQVESRFAHRPLRVGESALLSVELPPGQFSPTLRASLALPEALVAETPGLRDAAAARLWWRVRANSAGVWELSIELPEGTVTRRVVIGDARSAVSPIAYRADDWRTLTSPAEPALAGGAPAEAVELAYPPARGQLAGLSTASWLLTGVSLVLGFLLRGVFGVVI